MKRLPIIAAALLILQSAAVKFGEVTVCAAPLYAQTFGAQHLLPAGHWVYDAIASLAADAGVVTMADNAPLTVSELRLCLRCVPYEELSQPSRVLYDKVKSFLTTDAKGADLGLMRVGANIEASPTLMSKINDDIEWSYGARRTETARVGKLDSYSRDDLEAGKPINSANGLTAADSNFEYGDAGNYTGNYLTQPFAQVQFYVAVNDCLTMEADPCLASSFWGAADDNHFINFPKDYDNVEFYWPFNVYASWGIWRDNDSGSRVGDVASRGGKITGISIDGEGGAVSGEGESGVSIAGESEGSINGAGGTSGTNGGDAGNGEGDAGAREKAASSYSGPLGGVGINFNVARQGIQIGRTSMGSVIYNSTFQTDMCAQFSVYGRRFKYNLDLAQLGKERYIYLHYFESAPFKWLRFGLMEGTLIDAPFELKFMNPFMIMHSFGIWQFGEYDKTPLDGEIYGESHVAAYLAFNFDIVPCRYLRIYGLYSQNELQLPWELKSDNGKSMPNSFAGQLGVEVTMPGRRDDARANPAFWHWSVEGIYTSPWCYLKQDKSGCLMSARHDVQRKNDTDIYSWIGSPYGPDTMGFKLSALYERAGKWSAGAEYLFTARGTNSFGLFGNYIEIDGEKYYMYYPSVRYKMYDRFANSDFGLDASGAKDLAQDYSILGTVEYRNTVTVKGLYCINEHLEAGGRASFIFIFNNGHQGGESAYGAEVAASLKWKLL